MACDCLMNYLYSSLPCLLVWLSWMWFFSFCDDNQFNNVSIYERFSRSTRECWLCCLTRLGWIPLNEPYFRAKAHVLAVLLNSHFINVEYFYLVQLTWLRALDNCMELHLNSETALRYYFSVTFHLITFIN